MLKSKIQAWLQEVNILAVVSSCLLYIINNNEVKRPILPGYMFDIRIVATKIQLYQDLTNIRLGYFLYKFSEI